MGSIYESIELLSKEKGIETLIVLDAVKHALLVVAHKHYRTNEHYSVLSGTRVFNSLQHPDKARVE